MEAFLATVNEVFPTNIPFLSKDSKTDNVSIYNNNKNFADGDARAYGAITFIYEDTRDVKDIAYPFDKNNFTFPIPGETVMVIKNSDEYLWLPYSVTQYPNFREDYKTTIAGSGVAMPDKQDSKSNDYKSIESPIFYLQTEC